MARMRHDLYAHAASGRLWWERIGMYRRWHRPGERALLKEVDHGYNNRSNGHSRLL
jgi:hypothetical protein